MKSFPAILASVRSKITFSLAYVLIFGFTSPLIRTLFKLVEYPTEYVVLTPEITLTLTEGSDTRNAYIYYVNGTTIDYDLGYDGNLFGGVSHSLAVYSHLVNNDNGNKYQLQSLPDSNYENMVIPIGIIAAAGKEITFTAEALNLPNDLKVYLEDRLTNTVTRLD